MERMMYDKYRNELCTVKSMYTFNYTLDDVREIPQRVHVYSKYVVCIFLNIHWMMRKK